MLPNIYRNPCAASLLLSVFAALPVWADDCIPITEARQHVGEDRCISAKVLRVKRGERGVTFFDFCDDFRVCPFTVVVFPRDLKAIGDVRQLQNRVIEIHGPVKEYDGRAEIVLQRSAQLTGAAARIPRLPKDYDVERKGHYSPGSFSLPGTPYPTYKKRQPAKIPAAIPNDTGPVTPAAAETDPQ